MTKEQEEAIERLEELRDSYELHQRRWANRCLDIIEDYVKNSVYKKMMEETEYLEEDKAIEKLKKYIENDNSYNTYKEVKEDKRQGKIWGTHIDFCNAIETVLNMLKVRQIEIKKLKTDFKIVDQECSRLERKEAKQDKIIDLMADYIFQNIDVEEDVCNSVCIECKQETAQDITCINCIKQYFEQKATKMSQERKEEWKK